MSIQDDLMESAMLEAAIRECGKLVIRRENWEAVTLDVSLKMEIRKDGARVLTIPEQADD